MSQSVTGGTISGTTEYYKRDSFLGEIESLGRWVSLAEGRQAGVDNDADAG